MSSICSIRETISKISGEYFERANLVGLSIAVSYGLNEPELVTFGHKNWDKKTPIERDTVFRIGSVTKLVTAVAVLQLSEKGLINLDENVLAYLPELTQEFEKITISNLLNHTAGVPDFMDDSDQFLYEDKPASEIIDFIIMSKKKEKNKFSYSNSHYYLLGKAIEHVTGSTYESYVTKNILEPVGVERTVDFSCSSNKPKLATGYVQHPELKSKLSHPDRALSLLNGYASGNICSSASDLLKIVSSIFQERLISAQTLTKAMTTLPRGEGENSQYGFGMWKMDWPPVTGFGHGGTTWRYTAAAFHVPEKKLNIVVITNTKWVPKILNLVKDLALAL